MSDEKIYIQLLDGSTAWIPINAKLISDNQYKILDDKEFTDYVDPLYLHEFYPGDIVEISFLKFHDGNSVQVAQKIIAIRNWPDRQFNEFKFKATLGQLNINIQTAEKYKTQIDRLIKEHSGGQFFYPKLIEVAEKLKNLKND
jgi:hypothetical protein